MGSLRHEEVNFLESMVLQKVKTRVQPRCGASRAHSIIHFRSVPPHLKHWTVHIFGKTKCLTTIDKQKRLLKMALFIFSDGTSQGSFFSFLLFFKNYFIVVQLQLSAFSPHPSIPPQPNPPPSPASTLPLAFVHVSFIVVPENPLPTIPSLLPSGYC